MVSAIVVVLKSRDSPPCFRFKVLLDSLLMNMFLKGYLLEVKTAPNETMAINKFQRSKLTFDLSAKVAHFVVPSTY